MDHSCATVLRLHDDIGGVTKDGGCTRGRSLAWLALCRSLLTAVSSFKVAVGYYIRAR